MARSNGKTTLGRELYKKWAYQAARKYNINPAIFMSMIEAESAWNPRAKSKVGAMGLGQLMPATAKSLGVSDPFNARQNLDGSARYLRGRLDDIKRIYPRVPENQVYTLALASYNAGLGAVKKYGGVPPYKETQNYIATIGKKTPAMQREISNKSGLWNTDNYFGTKLINTAFDSAASAAAAAIKDRQAGTSSGDRKAEIANADPNATQENRMFYNKLKSRVAGTPTGEAVSLDGGMPMYPDGNMVYGGVDTGAVQTGPTDEGMLKTLMNTNIARQFPEYKEGLEKLNKAATDYAKNMGEVVSDYKAVTQNIPKEYKENTMSKDDQLAEYNEYKKDMNDLIQNAPDPKTNYDYLREGITKYENVQNPLADMRNYNIDREALAAQRQAAFMAATPAERVALLQQWALEDEKIANSLALGQSQEQAMDSRDYAVKQAETAMKARGQYAEGLSNAQEQQLRDKGTLTYNRYQPYNQMTGNVGDQAYKEAMINKSIADNTADLRSGGYNNLLQAQQRTGEAYGNALPYQSAFTQKVLGLAFPNGSYGSGGGAYQNPYQQMEDYYKAQGAQALYENRMLNNAMMGNFLQAGGYTGGIQPMQFGFPQQQQY